MAEKFVLPRLNNENYQTWKMRVEMMLKRDELWTVISEAKPIPVTPAWKTANMKALATIVLLLDDNQLSLVKDVDEASVAWQQLKDYHMKTTTTSRVSILKKICSLNMSDGGNMEKHIFEIEELFDRLSCAGLPLDEPMKIAMIYRSLPDSYSGLVTALESRPDADQTIGLAKQKLLDEYQRRVDRSGGTSEKAMKSQSKPRKERVCYHCRKPGHFKKDCYQLKQLSGSGGAKNSGKNTGTKAKQASEEEAPICFTIGSNRNKSAWYIDSGCSSHMANDAKFFRVLDKSASVNVILADGSVTVAAGIGEGVITCVDDDGTVREIVVKEVLYIPKLDSNLISVRKLTQKGLKVQFTDSKCEIQSEIGKVIAVAELNGNLYMLKEVERAKLGEEVRHLLNCQHMWHRRFGHRDPKILERIRAEDLATGFAMQDCGARQVCEHCLQGKLPRIPFPKASLNRAKRVLDLVHTDVCGPMKNVTPGGNAFFMTIIDDFSRYTVVCLLRHKSDAAACIKRYVAHVKNLFGRAPCVIRSDGGGEYVNHELKQFYAEEGIQAQITAAYSPQQNGVAERKNRTLQEMATCMLLDAGLKKAYWGEAIMTASYLQNRLPSRSVDTTPYERWYNKKPSMQHLRVFGTVAYVHIPEVKRAKLDPKAQKLVFVGYCTDRKAYRFVNPETDRVTISRDARFIELQDDVATCSDSIKKNDGGWIEISVDNGKDGTQEEPAVQEEQAVPEEREDSEEEFHGWDSGDEQPADAGGSSTKRQTRGVLPKRLEDYVVDVALAVEEPQNYEEAIKGPEREMWKAAMLDEYNSLMENGTWTLVELPAGRTAIGSKWVFKRKEDSDGRVSRFKARLVAQGFRQRYGVDYDAVFAPVATQSTLRVLLTIAGHKQLAVHHIDVKNAYLNGELREEVYMQQPKGFETPGKERLVCKLQRSLYGLKQAARIWNKTMDGLLVELGFVQSRADPCLYTKVMANGTLMYLLLYVDDMIVVCSDEGEIHNLTSKLQQKIKLSALGEVQSFLGIRISRDANGYFCMDQETYIAKVAEKHGLATAKGSKIPVDPGYYRNRNGSQQLPDNLLYRSLTGALLYVAVNTRPDIAASVSILSRQISHPTECDWTELKRIVRYLLRTNEYRLTLKSVRGEPMVLQGYSDADWSGDTADRKSNTGYMFSLGDAVICWASRKQTNVALSSMEAEYVALSEACREVVWLRRLLEEVQLKQTDATVIYEDNRSCIDFIGIERQSRQSKHIDTRMCFARDLVEKGTVRILYCPSEEMKADILTKPLGGTKQLKFSKAMGLEVPVRRS